MPKAPWLKTAPKIYAHTNCAVLRSSRPWRPWYYLTVLYGVPINYLSWFCPTFWWGTHGGHVTDFTPPREQFPHNYISSWDIFFFFKKKFAFYPEGNGILCKDTQGKILIRDPFSPFAQRFVLCAQGLPFGVCFCLFICSIFLLWPNFPFF